MQDTSRLINQKPWQVIGTAVGSLLILGLQGCTWLISLGVSEKGKERCLQQINRTDNSFVSELSFRKCIKGVDAILASEEKERAAIANAGKNPAYIKQWEKDRGRLNMALNHNYKKCDNEQASAEVRSRTNGNILWEARTASENRSWCISAEDDRIRQLAMTLSSDCSELATFERWFKWAIQGNRGGSCDGILQLELKGK